MEYLPNPPHEDLTLRANAGMLRSFLRDDTRALGGTDVGPTLLANYRALLKEPLLSGSYQPTREVELLEQATRGIRAGTVFMDGLVQYEDHRDLTWLSQKTRGHMAAVGSSEELAAMQRVHHRLDKHRVPPLKNIEYAMSTALQSAEKCLNIIEYAELRRRYSADELTAAKNNGQFPSANHMLENHLLAYEELHKKPELMQSYFRTAARDFDLLSHSCGGSAELLKEEPRSPHTRGDFPYDEMVDFITTTLSPGIVAMCQALRLEILPQLQEQVGLSRLSDKPFAFGRVDSTRAAAMDPAVVSLDAFRGKQPSAKR